LLELIITFAPASSSAHAAQDKEAENTARPQDQITFTRHIAPIIFEHCSGCHRPGQSAPFALLTYHDLQKHAEDILTVTHSRYMPPWPPENPGFFLGERRLNAEELRIISQWAKGGMIEGAAADLPPRPQWPSDWQLGPPDMVERLYQALTPLARQYAMLGMTQLCWGGPVSRLLGLLDPSLPKGALNYWKAHFLTDLSDGAIDAMVEAFSQCESPMSQIVIEHFHGAASRVPVQDTACAMRITGFNVVIISQWMDAKENDQHIAWCRDTYKALGPYLGTTRYVNYLDVDEAGDPAAVAYGPNYARLRELKTKFDPDNVFHVNVNVKPR